MYTYFYSFTLLYLITVVDEYKIVERYYHHMNINLEKLGKVKQDPLMRMTVTDFFLPACKIVSPQASG